MKNRSALILLLALSVHPFVTGNEWNYEVLLKKAKNKTMKGSVQGVDFMYVINLDQRPEKYLFVKKQFSRFGICPYRFSAVNGWELSPEVMGNLGLTVKKKVRRDLKGTYYAYDEKAGLKEHHIPLSKSCRPCLSHCMSRGAAGIVLSHLSVIKDAYDSGFNRVWIMEDDIEILGDIKEIESLIKEVNRSLKDWDILYTDIDTKSNNGTQRASYGMAYRPDLVSMYSKKSTLVKRTRLTKNLTLLGNRFGAYSYIINRAGMKKVLEYFKKHYMFFPYDMELIYINGLKQVALTFNLVSTKTNSPSDNGGPNYLNKK